ncbi:hypothetical protein STA3757_42050 [Stanieria sp. NIES-3757]|nr:hypothetical protein STA3757_42050 [Stanieria sp. NIES-3757]
MEILSNRDRQFIQLITLSNSPASILGLAGNQSMDEQIIQNAFAAE